MLTLSKCPRGVAALRGESRQIEIDNVLCDMTVLDRPSEIDMTLRTERERAGRLLMPCVRKFFSRTQDNPVRNLRIQFFPPGISLPVVAFKPHIVLSRLTKGFRFHEIQNI